MQNGSRVLLIFLAGLALAAAPGRAATLSFSTSFSNIPVDGVSFPRFLTIPKFDPGVNAPIGATLNSITFSLTGSDQVQLTATNNGTQPAVTDLASQTTLTLTRPDLSTIVVSIPAVQFLGVNLAPGVPVTTPLRTGTATNAATVPPPVSDLTLFAGVGNISLPVGASTSTSFTGANINTSSVVTASALLNLTYDYSAAATGAPEPMTMAYAGLGLMLLGAGPLRRRLPWR